MSSKKSTEKSSSSSNNNKKKPKTTPARSVSDISTASSSIDSTTALFQLLSPDGYYAYLGIQKPADPTSGIDEELVKKNYRRLSLKHHPDRRSGDTETFRVLKRAQVVLLNQKLREQYDILGLDLDDDEEEHHHDQEDEKKDDKDNAQPPPVPETIVSHMATAALAGIMQLGVRTAMMGAVSVFFCRWRITVFPALAFLVFIMYRIVMTVRNAPAGSGASYWDLLSPLTIGVGTILLHRGRDFPETTWSYMFWMGETMVMTMFTLNSIPPNFRTPPLVVCTVLVALLLSLWLRGQFWRYATICAMIGFVAIVTAMAFPLMELVLEEIIKEKLKKVGEKVRAHNQRMEEYYMAKASDGVVNNNKASNS